MKMYLLVGMRLRMENKILSKLYKNTKFCPYCKRKEMGIVQSNGTIRLPCGTTTNADRKWHMTKNNNEVTE